MAGTESFQDPRHGEDSAGANRGRSYIEPSRPLSAGTESVRLPADTDSLNFTRFLGRGGMGAVFEAVEPASGRRVAVKVVSSIEPTPAELLRFDREARAAAAVFHPNSVCIFGSTRIESMPAIVMEFVEGGDLETHLQKRGSVDVEQCIEWGMELLGALAAVHERGLVHRDVKPSNVLVTRDARLKLSDYGLARSEDAETALTKTGQFVGTPQYASPEQTRGERLTPRSDIFSVGCVLYRILAGLPPFGHPNVLALLEQIRTRQEEPLTVVRPDVPRELASVIARSMSKLPERRFGDCREFHDALASLSSRVVRPSDQGRRIGAWLVDQLCLGLPLLIGEALFVPASSFSYAAAINLLWVAYYALLENRALATPGKMLFRLRVVSTSGEAATMWQCLVRALVFVIPGRAASWSFPGIPTHPVLSWFLRIAIGYGWLAVLFITSRRRSGRRGLHELLSGTCVRHRSRVTSPAGFPVLEGASCPVGGDSTPGRRSVAKSRRGELFEAYDAQLRRPTLVFVPESPHGPVVRFESALRTLSADGREVVLEHPGGATLAAIGPGVLGWSATHRILTQLAQEMVMAPRAVPCEFIWVDESLHPIVLDFMLDPQETAVAERGTGTVVDAARHMMLSKGGHKPFDMPVSAESVVDRLLKDDGVSLPEILSALERLIAGTGDVLTTMDRCAPLVLLLALWFTALHWLGVPEPQMAYPAGRALLSCGLIPGGLFALSRRTLFSYWLCGLGMRCASNSRAPRGAVVTGVFNLFIGVLNLFIATVVAPAVLNLVFWATGLGCIGASPRNRLGDQVLGRRAFVQLATITAYCWTAVFFLEPLSRLTGDSAGLYLKNMLETGPGWSIALLTVLLGSHLLVHAAVLFSRPGSAFHEKLGIQVVAA